MNLPNIPKKYAEMNYNIYKYVKKRRDKIINFTHAIIKILDLSLMAGGIFTTFMLYIFTIYSYYQTKDFKIFNMIIICLVLVQTEFMLMMYFYKYVKGEILNM